MAKGKVALTGPRKEGELGKNVLRPGKEEGNQPCRGEEKNPEWHLKTKHVTEGREQPAQRVTNGL